MPQSYADLLRPDSQLNSSDTNTAGETISNSHPSLYFPDIAFLILFSICSGFSNVSPSSFSARLPQLPSELTYIPLGQFIQGVLGYSILWVRSIRFTSFNTCTHGYMFCIYNARSLHYSIDVSVLNTNKYLFYDRPNE